MRINTILSLLVTSLVCKASAECFADKLGYSCCTKTKNVVYIDRNGKWGVEDGKKCGIEPITYPNADKRSLDKLLEKRGDKGKKKDKEEKKQQKKEEKEKKKEEKKKEKEEKKKEKEEKQYNKKWAGYMDKVQIDSICPAEIMTRADDVTYPEYSKVYYYSTTTESERPLNVVLPPGYDKSKKYPVLYYLHGIMCDEDTMLEEPFGAIATYGNLLKLNRAKEMIIVVPYQYAPAPGTEIEPSFNQSYYDGYDNFINDLIDNIMPYMEKNYSIATGRENTAICGFSFGGRNTLYIGYTRSDLFGYIGAFSPAPGVVEAEDMYSHHKGLLQPEDLVAEYPPILSMLSCGTNDNVVGSFPKEYHELLEKNNQKHVWYEIPNADHDLTAISTGLYNFIDSIFGILNEKKKTKEE